MENLGQYVAMYNNINKQQMIHSNVLLSNSEYMQLKVSSSYAFSHVYVYARKSLKSKSLYSSFY
jgi:hypothetical protein